MRQKQFECANSISGLQEHKKKENWTNFQVLMTYNYTYITFERIT